jgi:hypothetical protein
MKVSITLDFDSPDHAIVALNHIDELRKGNFGETTTKASGSNEGSAPADATTAEPTPKVTKPRKPRKPKAEPAATAPVDTPPAGSAKVPSLPDVQAAVKGIFETKGAVVALGLLRAMGAERAADLPEDKRADFIAQAKAL